MDRRAFFKGVAAMAAGIALEPVPQALLPAGRWVVYCVDELGPTLTRAVMQAALMRKFYESDMARLLPTHASLKEVLGPWDESRRPGSSKPSSVSPLDTTST